MLRDYISNLSVFCIRIQVLDLKIRLEHSVDREMLRDGDICETMDMHHVCA